MGLTLPMHPINRIRTTRLIYQHYLQFQYEFLNSTISIENIAGFGMPIQL